MKNFNGCGILIVKTKGFLSKIVSIFSSSRYTHCAIYCGNLVIEIIGANGEYPDIEIHDLRDYLSRFEVWMFKLDELDYEKTLTFLQEKQKYVSYSWWRSISWIFRITGYNYKNYHKWNCIDLVYFTLKDQNITLWDGRNISPKKLLGILKKFNPGRHLIEW